MVGILLTMSVILTRGGNPPVTLLILISKVIIVRLYRRFSVLLYRPVYDVNPILFYLTSSVRNLQCCIVGVWAEYTLFHEGTFTLYLVPLMDLK